MNFEDRLQKHILSLEQSPDYKKDLALKRIVQLFKQVKTQNDLQNYNDLIGRILGDSVQNLDIINFISMF